VTGDHDDHDDQGLATALRDRLDDVRPDLDRLVAVATRQGTRIRRRTRLAVSIGCLAGAAAVVVLAGSWAGSSPSGAPGGTGFADEPTASSSPASPTPSVVTTTPSAPATHAGPPPERSPVALDLPGWTCTPPADEKFICSSGGHSVVVNWRPGSERPFWGASSDKTADWISAVHRGVFVTVVASPDTPGSEAVSVGEALTWSQ
jgi:hypothetical protein